MDLKESEIIGEDAPRHWYYRSKAAAMLRYLDGQRFSRILDIGAGSGFFSKYLLEHSTAASGICVDTGYPRDWEEQHAGKTLAFRRSVDADQADLVMFMDVLEHVDDDVGMLVAYAAKATRGASLLITVPAFQWLWSDHDVFLEHRRRYDVADLEIAVRRAGLSIVRSSYYFGLVFPIAAALRLAGKLRSKSTDAPKSQLKKHGAATNSILTAMCMAELPLLRLNRLAGLSVFCLARKGR
jgi:hypothetical protein